MNAHSVTKNRYFDNEKNHTIFTPPPLAKWLRQIMEPELKDVEVVFDPAVGSGNLTDLFPDKFRIGCDIEDFEADLDVFEKGDFLMWSGDDYPKMDLVVMNPPYNHTKESAKKWGRSSLFPELFADKCFKLFGKDVKVVLFTPMGFRLNTRCFTTKQGTRYRNIRDNFGELTSVITLPLDVFPNPDFDPMQPEVRKNPKKNIKASNIRRKETQQEILLFNMPKLKPHYCLPEWVFDELRIMDKEAFE